MSMRRGHRIGSIIFGVAVGLAVAIGSYQWVTDPVKRAERAEQERLVLLSRALLAAKLGIDDPEIVDPLAPKRSVGKVYIYPGRDGSWEISGYYRRDADDRWHPYLMTLAADESLRLLKVQDTDAEIAARTVRDPALEVVLP